MTSDQFTEWVAVHCKFTGGNADTAALLTANRGVICERWDASYAELSEVSTRLIESGRSPKFPNEQMNSLKAELDALRNERADDQRPDLATETFEECDACGGSGFVVVPVRACVWQGRLVLHKGLKRVMTGAVLCDRGGCDAGRRARDTEQRRSDKKPNRPTLTQAERVCGVDLVAMMRDYERECARRAWACAEPGDDAFAKLAASIVSKARSN